MQHTKLITFIFASLFFITVVLSSPLYFDATDGAEFAVSGTNLQIAHAPGYPLFLLLVRIFSMIFSPLYGHLLLLNAFMAILAVIIGIQAFNKYINDYFPSLVGLALFLFSAPIISQFNSLEVYPLAILLVLSAIAFKDTKLAAYTSGMAIFAGHPVALLTSSLFLSIKQKLHYYLIMLIPATLYLYIPIRAGSCRIAHFGHPTTLYSLIGYFNMYSERLNFPSFERLFRAISFINLSTGITLLFLAVFAGKIIFKKDIPILLSLLFLSSYELPDPAGQLWILLLPLAIRASFGIKNIYSWLQINHPTKNILFKVLLTIIVVFVAATGTISGNRSEDDIALRWTLDIMTNLPQKAIYRTLSHDTFYAAYTFYTLKIRPDIILSDPYGNFFEFFPPTPISSSIGERPVCISRAWNRLHLFSLNGLFFIPTTLKTDLINWDNFSIFTHRSFSPDPMAMDLVAEAWMRRMLQENNETARHYCFEMAIESATTSTTRERIEDANQAH